LAILEDFIPSKDRLILQQTKKNLPRAVGCLTICVLFSPFVITDSFIQLKKLDVFYNNYTISKNYTAVVNLNNLVNLIELSFIAKEYKILVITKCVKLRKLTSNCIRNINLLNFEDLRELNCQRTTFATETVFKFINLISLNCIGCEKITNESLKNCLKLKYLYCAYTSIEINGDLELFKNLEELDCCNSSRDWRPRRGPKLINLNNFKNLKKLKCDNVDVANFNHLHSLVELSCKNNFIVININLPNLKLLDCEGCYLLEFINKSQHLTILNCNRCHKLQKIKSF
jgi:hypothetical protein